MVILAWHVEYQDYLGWKDQFGVKAHKDRQKTRSATAKLRTLETPLTLIDSAPASAGWDSKLREEAGKPAAVTIEAETAIAGTALTVRVKLTSPQGELPAGAVVRPVLFQREVEVAIATGDNAGKRLVQHFPVRLALAPIAAADALAGFVEATGELPAGVLPEDLGIAVLVEDGTTLRTIEAATFRLTKPVPGLLVVVDPDKERGPKVRDAVAKRAADSGFLVALAPSVFANDRQFDLFIARQKKTLKFDERRMVLLGFSTAAKDAWEFALKYKARVAGLVVVAGKLELTAAEVGQIGQGVPVMMVYGRDDKAAPAEEGDALFRLMLSAQVPADWALMDVADSFAVLTEGMSRFLPWAAKQSGPVRQEVK